MCTARDGACDEGSVCVYGAGWGLCEYVIVHTILPPSPVILWREMGGKPNGFH